MAEASPLLKQRGVSSRSLHGSGALGGVERYRVSRGRGRDAARSRLVRAPGRAQVEGAFQGMPQSVSRTCRSLVLDEPSMCPERGHSCPGACNVVLANPQRKPQIKWQTKSQVKPHIKRAQL